MRLLAATRVALATVIFAAGLAVAHSDDWPLHPIRMIVGFGPGGGTDIAARFVAAPLSEILGQPVVVENRTGAGGMTGAELVAHGSRDGTIALMMSNAHAISAVMYKTLPYDPMNDFQMVSMVATAGLVLVAAPDFPAKNLSELVALVRANPGKYNFGSAGVGTTQQFAGELLKQTAGLNIVHVPYRTTPAVVAGLLGKEVSFVFELVQAVQGQIQTGALKAIAVTSPQRNPVLPDVPTFAEAGIPGYEVTSWYGVAFPGGTPMPIVDKTNAGIRKLLESDAVRKQVLTMGAAVKSSTPDELKTHIASEIAKWNAVREKAGIPKEQ
ncbi:MAG TPA: tripartite tricarboxylate transporter substrate binding protein [Xanthobacteraceae bacterium]|jgi:tripartite-type tricarboxylate transporter receptor subunit TctC|nr:tripartite tricarboxylate transporter substrate binding protein [Xanthobacteraceae bacterium]